MESVIRRHDQARPGGRRREKLFGEGRLVPLDRNAKIRIMTLARALSHRTESGKHYGIVTAKFVAVLEALLWGFHNAASGRCFPSYERIAEHAHCSRATVYNAIHALELAGLLTWVNRIKRVREWGADLFGRAQNAWRIERTSNAYVLIDPQPKPPEPTKSKFSSGTESQVLFSSVPRVLDGENLLHQALQRLGKALESKESVAPSGATKGLAT